MKKSIKIMQSASKLICDLEKNSSKETAKALSRFFKTGKGEYGDGDVFIGIKVPVIRKIIKNYLSLDLNEIQKLISSDIHEVRFAALQILHYQFKKSKDETVKKKIYEFYIKNRPYVNNWDLVDTSTPHIVGEYLLTRDRKILYKLAVSNSLWERRIAIMATFTFIRELDFEDSIQIAKILLKDKEDLIHKAVGWMIREIANRDLSTAENFLKPHYKKMPRTMLRYAIEKFEEKKRKAYLNNKI